MIFGSQIGPLIDPVKVAMAIVHRPGTEVVDFPAGMGADQLDTKELNVVELPDVGMQMATIHRPSDEVVEFPPGRTADQVMPVDCHVVEIAS